MKNKLLSSLFLFTFFFSIVGEPASLYAQVNNAGFSITPPIPAMLKGLRVYPDNSLLFDFIVDPGSREDSAGDLRNESERLIKYFLASLTIPEKNRWVNLAPQEADRIIPKDFAQTQMGRDLLAEDYVLKQLSSGLMHPDNEFGRQFWNRLQVLVKERYGIESIPEEIAHRIWIEPNSADVYVNGNVVMVIGGTMKIKLKEESPADEGSIATQAMEEVIIPEIEKEVNEGKSFIKLRQIYNALILAEWYRRHLKESLLGKVYVEKSKIGGINRADDSKMVYEKYMDALKKGSYEYFKEEYDFKTQEIISKKYFSGGTNLTSIVNFHEYSDAAALNQLGKIGNLSLYQVKLENESSKDFAIIDDEEKTGNWLFKGLDVDEAVKIMRNVYGKLEMKDVRRIRGKSKVRLEKEIAGILSRIARDGQQLFKEQEAKQLAALPNFVNKIDDLAGFIKAVKYSGISSKQMSYRYYFKDPRSFISLLQMNVGFDKFSLMTKEGLFEDISIEETSVETIFNRMNLSRRENKNSKVKIINRNVEIRGRLENLLNKEIKLSLKRDPFLKKEIQDNLKLVSRNNVLFFSASQVYGLSGLVTFKDRLDLLFELIDYRKPDGEYVFPSAAVVRIVSAKRSKEEIRNLINIYLKEEFAADLMGNFINASLAYNELFVLGRGMNALNKDYHNLMSQQFISSFIIRSPWLVDVIKTLEIENWHNADFTKIDILRNIIASLKTGETMQYTDAIYLNYLRKESDLYKDIPAETQRMVKKYLQEDFMQDAFVSGYIGILNQFAVIFNQPEPPAALRKDDNIDFTITDQREFLRRITREGKPFFSDKVLESLSIFQRLEERKPILSKLIYWRDQNGYLFAGTDMILLLRSKRSNDELIDLIEFMIKTDLGNGAIVRIIISKRESEDIKQQIQELWAVKEVMVEPNLSNSVLVEMIINGKEVKKLFQLFNKAMQDAGEDNEKAEVYRTAKTILYIYGNIHYSKIARDQLIRNFESGADIRAKLDAKGWQMVDRVMVSNIFQDGTIDRLEQLYLNVFNSDNTPYQAEEKKVIYSQEEYAHNIKIIEKVAEIDKKRKKLVSAHKKIKIQLLGMKRNGKPLFDENTAGALSRSYRLTEFLKILENMIYLKSVTGQYMFTGGQVVFALKSWRSNEEILRLLKFLDDHGMTPRNGARIINTANTESTIMSSVDFFQQLETGQGKNIFTGLRIADIILNLERFVKGIKIVAGLSGTADLKNFNLSGEQRKDIFVLIYAFSSKVMADNLKKLFVNIDNNQPLFSGILESDKGPALKYLQMSNFDFKAANALVQHFLSDQYRQIKKGDAVAVDMAVLDTPVGGVDFNAQDLNIQATVGSTQTFEYDVAQFREGFEGFRPVIINAYNIVSINELLATVP